MTWSWNAGSQESGLNVLDDGSAIFHVPGDMAPGDSRTFSVACNGDKRLAVSVTVAVEKEPEPEPEPEEGFWGFGVAAESGGDAGSGGENDTGTAE